MIEINCVQGTEDWWIAKRGIPSASNFSRIFTAKTMKVSAQAKDYIAELLADTASLTPPYFTEQGRPVNTAMANGQAVEPEARRWFELQTGKDVRQVGFCVHDNGLWGCSPDGLIDPDEGLELKCPMLKSHIGYLLRGELPPKHKAQCHGCLIVTGRKVWNYMSYAVGADPLLLRVTPDDYTEKLHKALEDFSVMYAEARKTIGMPEREDPNATITPAQFTELAQEIDARVIDGPSLLEYVRKTYQMPALAEPDDLRQLPVSRYHDLIGKVRSKPLRAPQSA